MLKLLLFVFVAAASACGPRSALTSEPDGGAPGAPRADAAADDLAARADAALAADATLPDAAPGDAGRPDAPAVLDDASLAFPTYFEGLWLIGWSGGMNHFSWVRFGKLVATMPSSSEAWILEGEDIIGNAPLWSCHGKTTWGIGAAADTAYLDFPSTSCDPQRPNSIGLVFGELVGPGSGAPPGAMLSTTVKEQATLQAMVGYKYPDTWCDAAMTHCKAPF